MKIYLIVFSLLFAVSSFGQQRLEHNFKIDDRAADRYFLARGITTLDVPIQKIWLVQRGQEVFVLPSVIQGLQRFVVLNADSTGADCDTLIFRRGNGNLFRLSKQANRVYRIQELLNDVTPINRGTHAGRSDDFLRDHRFRNDPDSLAQRFKNRKRVRNVQGR